MASAQNFILNVDNPLDALNRGLQEGERLRRQPILQAEEDKAFARQDEAFARQNVLQGRDDLLFQQQQTDRQSGLDVLQTKKAEAEQFKVDAASLVQNQSDESYAAFLAKYPSYQKELQAVHDTLDKANQKNDILNVKQFKTALDNGNVDVAKTLLDDRIEGLRAVGRDLEADTLSQMDRLVDVSPEAALASAGLFLAAVDPAKKTNVTKTVTYNDGTTMSIMSNNDRIVKNPEGVVVEGKAAAQAIATARKSGITEAGDKARTIAEEQADVELATVGGIKRAELETAQAVKRSGQMLDNYDQSTKTITLLRQARQHVINGAETGAIADLLPTLRSESIKLKNIQKQLGLQVIGDVTFGALSKGELDLALETALPTNLEGQPLIDWIDSAIEARQKVADIMLEASDHLSREGNTINTWIQLQKQKNEPAVSDDIQNLFDTYGG